jgi:hypothetical protein
LGNSLLDTIIYTPLGLRTRSMSDIWVKSITHLKDMPRADTALEMLKKIASLVKPIMRRHRWVLPVLAEFFPDNSSLLGTFELDVQQSSTDLTYR